MADEKERVITMQKGLLLLLEQMTKLQEELLPLEEEKKEALIRGEISRLSEIVQLETQKINLLSKLEREREKAAEELAFAWNLPPESLTLSALTDRMEDPYLKGRFQELQKLLNERSQQLQRQNEINQILIRDSLDYVNMAFSLLTDQEENKVYTNHPSEEGEKSSSPRSFFDTRI
ncbi:putative FlgN family protein [[Clostridium] ultunense Esp]|nr:putative FlgN family protein [[Clostridium] ultunense Esp]